VERAVDNPMERGITIDILWSAKESWKKFLKALASSVDGAVEIQSPPTQVISRRVNLREARSLGNRRSRRRHRQVVWSC
jgi:hypothetical protein